MVKGGALRRPRGGRREKVGARRPKNADAHDVEGGDTVLGARTRGLMRPMSSRPRKAPRPGGPPPPRVSPSGGTCRHTWPHLLRGRHGSQSRPDAMEGGGGAVNSPESSESSKSLLSTRTAPTRSDRRRRRRNTWHRHTHTSLNSLTLRGRKRRPPCGGSVRATEAAVRGRKAEACRRLTRRVEWANQVRGVKPADAAPAPRTGVVPR